MSHFCQQRAKLLALLVCVALSSLLSATNAKAESALKADPSYVYRLEYEIEYFGELVEVTQRYSMIELIGATCYSVAIYRHRLDKSDYRNHPDSTLLVASSINFISRSDMLKAAENLPAPVDNGWRYELLDNNPVFADLKANNYSIKLKDRERYLVSLALLPQSVPNYNLLTKLERAQRRGEFVPFDFERAMLNALFTRTNLPADKKNPDKWGDIICRIKSRPISGLLMSDSNTWQLELVKYVSYID